MNTQIKENVDLDFNQPLPIDVVKCLPLQNEMRANHERIAYCINFTCRMHLLNNRTKTPLKKDEAVARAKDRWAGVLMHQDEVFLYQQDDEYINPEYKALKQELSIKPDKKLKRVLAYDAYQRFPKYFPLKEFGFFDDRWDRLVSHGMAYLITAHNYEFIKSTKKLYSTENMKMEDDLRLALTSNTCPVEYVMEDGKLSYSKLIFCIRYTYYKEHLSKMNKDVKLAFEYLLHPFYNAKIDRLSRPSETKETKFVKQFPSHIIPKEFKDEFYEEKLKDRPSLVVPCFHITDDPSDSTAKVSYERIMM